MVADADVAIRAVARCCYVTRAAMPLMLRATIDVIATTKYVMVTAVQCCHAHTLR